MKKAPFYPAENCRITRLREFGILDTKPEPEFDQLTQFARELCQTPIALISLIDTNRQWFKSTVGLDVRETARDISFCDHAIHCNDLFIVENALEDDRFKDNPLVINQPHIVFYAGSPLITDDGFHLGTICVIDHKPKNLSQLQKNGLRLIANSAMKLFQLRKLKYQLAETEKSFTAIQELANAGVWELDIESGNTTWSKKVYDIYKIPYETATNVVDGLSYYSPESQKILQDLISNCIKMGTPFDQTFEFKDAANNAKWVRSIGHQSQSNNSKNNKIQGIFQDITSLKNQETKILESKKELELAHQFLDLALEGASLGIWDWDLVTNNVTFDQRWAHMLGLNINEIDMKLSTWENLVHPDDLASCYNDIQSYMQGKSDYYENIHRMRHKNGQWIYILDRGKFSAWDDLGNPIRFTGTHFNLTKQVLNENTIRMVSDIRAAYIEKNTNHEDYLQLLISKILNITESQYGFIGEVFNSENGSDLKILGISDISWDEETKRRNKEKNSMQILSRDLSPLYKEVLKSGKTFITNAPQSHSFMGVPIYHNKKMTAMIGIANRKEGYDESLHQHLAPVFQVVGDIIYAQSLEKEIEKQKKIAFQNAKLASIGQLAAGVGHEINNPLTIVIGQLELFKNYLITKGHFDEKVEERTKIIMASCQRIAQIVKGLRGFSRMGDTDISVVNINEVIKATLSLLSNIFDKNQIKIKYEQQDSIYIKANTGRLEQILLNLLINARDALTDFNEIDDKIIHIRSYLEGEKAVLSVEDNGPGIKDDIKEKIFEPFFTTKELNQGTGLGLALVSSMVKDFGGTIVVETFKTKGTKFILKFPALD